MDIFKHITRLRNARRGFTLSAGAQAMYYELLAINNEERWAAVFKCKSSELCSALSVSEKTLTGYREELLAAGLIGYRSGRHKREPSDYSMNGSSIGVTNGSNNGGNIYHQTEHQTGSKTPDLLREKRKSKNKIIHSSNNHPADFEEDERERLIKHFCEDKDEEKEKGCAEKEKPPTAADADKAFKLVYPVLYEQIMMANRERAGTDELRMVMLELFWAENYDDYCRKVPPWKDIITHFRNWIPKYTIVKKLQDGKITHTGSTKERTEDKRNQLRNLKDGSAEFLRRADH